LGPKKREAPKMKYNPMVWFRPIWKVKLEKIPHPKHPTFKGTTRVERTKV